MDFTQATASTPLRTPLSKRRISTPHHKPIASSPPENVEADCTGPHSEPVWEDVEEDAREDYASEGEFMANDRDSSPEYQDAEDKTAQDQGVTNTVQADDDTTLPAADESEDEEEEEQVEEAEGEEEEEHSQEQAGGNDAHAQEAPITQRTANSEYVTIRTVVVKTEDNAAEADPEDRESLTHEEETEDIAASSEVAVARETIETVQVTQTLAISPVEEPLTTSAGQAHVRSEPVVADQDLQGDGSVQDASRSERDASRSHQSDSEGPHIEAPRVEAERAPEPRPESDVDEETEISLETARGTESMQTGIDNDYTRAPIVISSQDPRAAALAAAILRKVSLRSGSVAFPRPC